MLVARSKVLCVVLLAAAATGCGVGERDLSASSDGDCAVGSSCSGAGGQLGASPAGGGGGASGSGASEGMGGTPNGSGGMASGGNAGMGSGGSGAGGSGGSLAQGGAMNMGGAMSTGGAMNMGGSGPSLPSVCGQELLGNGGVESGVAPWVEFYSGVDPVISSEELSEVEGTLAYTGAYLMWFGGAPSEVSRLSQRVTIPQDAVAITISGFRRFKSAVVLPNSTDRMRIALVRGVTLLQELSVWGNEAASAGAEWERFDFRIDATPYLGTDVTLELECTTAANPDTNFYFDDLSLIAECAP